MLPDRISRSTAWACAALYCAAALRAAPPETVDTGSSKLKIVVLEGQGSINNLRAGKPGEIVVRVDKEDGTAVPGAAVVFTLPSHGPTGEFSNGGKTLAVTADAHGIAAVRSFRPQNVAGKMEIRVSASSQGETARAVVTQFNMVVRNASGGHGKLIAALVIVGAAAGGAVAGVRMSQNKSAAGPAAAPPSVTISPADNSIGPPR